MTIRGPHLLFSCIASIPALLRLDLGFRWQFPLVLLRLADDSACLGEATYSATVTTMGSDAWACARQLSVAHLVEPRGKAVELKL